MTPGLQFKINMQNLTLEKIVSTINNWQNRSSKHKWLVKTLFCAAGCASLLVFRIIVLKIRNKLLKRPPQLYGLPVIGSLLTMTIWQDTLRSKIFPSYGDAVSFSVGNFNRYEINDLQLANAIFSKTVNRIAFGKTLFEPFGYVAPVTIVNNDENWSHRRKTIMGSIAMLLDKSTLEENIAKILQQITYKELNEKLEMNNKYIWYPRKFLQNAVFNVIYLAMFGKTILIDDPKYEIYLKSTKSGIEDAIGGLLSQSVPKFIADKIGLTRTAERYKKYLNLLRKITQQDYETVVSNSSSNSMTTLAQCLASGYNDRVSGNNKTNKMDDVTFARTIADLAVLLGAGLDTTGHTSEVGVLLLAKYPAVQELVYKELCNVYGINGNFTFDKVYQCVQLKAFVNETLRIACPTPDGVGRCCDKELRCIKWYCKKDKNVNMDKKFHILCDYSDSDAATVDFDTILNDKNNVVVYDYVFEANLSIQINMEYMMRWDKKIWNLDNDAKVLNLNYWLKKDGKTGKLKFKHNSNSIPFSVGGNRDCLGQSLARKELLAFLANLILKYKIRAPNGDPSSIDLKYVNNGVTHFVQPQICVEISKRQPM